MSFPGWHEHTVVFGGGFDPPHLGHRAALEGLFRHPGAARAIVLPSASPPHKPHVASAEHRLAMVRLAFAEFRAGPLEISELELERARREPARPTYTWDTLQVLKPRYPRLAFVAGTDQLAKLHTWHRFPDLLGAADWLILARKPDGPALAAQTLREWTASGLVKAEYAANDHETLWKTRFGTRLGVVSTDAPALSSTQIREAMARTGQAPENTLAPAVSAYLVKMPELYGTRTGS